MDSSKLQHSEKMIAMGKAALATDPKTAIYWLTSSYRNLAAHHSTSDVGKCLEYLLQAVDWLITGYEDFSLTPALTVQNDAMIFACAAGSLRKARRVAAIPVKTKDNHKFDVLLNYRLRKALGIAWPYEVPKYEPTSTEEPLFSSLALLAENPSSFSSDGLSSYWRGTRNRRYAFTVHQNIDLFSAAGANISRGVDSAFPSHALS